MIGPIMAAVLTIPGFGQAGGSAPPSSPTLEFVFEEVVTLGPSLTPGRTPYGGRNIGPITGGTFQGPRIRGEVLPMGWDWQLSRSDGCLDVSADYFLRTDDGVIIHIVNKGVACRPQLGEHRMTTTAPVFEAPSGKYDWMNKAMFVDTLELTKMSDGRNAVRIRIYQVRA